MNFRGAKFIKSASTSSEAPTKSLKEVVFVGRSNVGKSSLINALCDNKNLVFTSSKPGHTRLLNYFEIQDELYLVDAPGYGYSSAGKAHSLAFGKMMEEYFSNCKNLSLVVFLVDGRREPNEDDDDFYHLLLDSQIPYCIVITKYDKLNQKEKAQCKKMLELHFKETPFSQIYPVSSIKKEGLTALKKRIEQI